MTTATDRVHFVILTNHEGVIDREPTGYVCGLHDFAFACDLAAMHPGVTRGQVFAAENGEVRLVAQMAVVR